MDMGLTRFQKRCLEELDGLHNVMIREVIGDWSDTQNERIRRKIKISTEGKI